MLTAMSGTPDCGSSTKTQRAAGAHSTAHEVSQRVSRPEHSACTAGKPQALSAAAASMDSAHTALHLALHTHTADTGEVLGTCKAAVDCRRIVHGACWTRRPGAVAKGVAARAQHRHSGCGVVVGGVVVCRGQRHQVHKGARRSGDSGVGVRPAGRHTRSLDASRCHTMQDSRARMQKPPTGQPRSGAAASQAAAAAAETTGRTQTCNAPTITPTQTQQHILHPQHCLTRFGPFAECCQCCRTARCLDP